MKEKKPNKLLVVFAKLTLHIIHINYQVFLITLLEL